MKKESAWINDILKAAEAEPAAIPLIEACGRSCAEQGGHIEGGRQLGQAATSCKSRSYYVAFMRATFPFDVEEAEDGIIIRFHKEKCTCPMADEVANPMLCNCTLGHEKAMWSAFFGKPVEAKIVESFQRGGKDCVIKLFI